MLGGAVRTSKGSEIPADDFFVSHFTTTLEPDELVTATLWPEGGAVGFEEVALRHGDYALSMCACSVRVDGGEVTEARVGVGSVVDRPTLLDLELAGADATDETARAAGAAAGRTGRSAGEPARVGGVPETPDRGRRRASADAGIRG